MNGKKGPVILMAGWFSKIRDMVRDHIASKRLAAGKTIKRKTLPIARKVCGDCIAFHLKQGSIIGVEKAVSILTTFYAIGRAGEAGWVTYDNAYWNYTESCLYVIWNEPKVVLYYSS